MSDGKSVLSMRLDPDLKDRVSKAIKIQSAKEGKPMEIIWSLLLEKIIKELKK